MDPQAMLFIFHLCLAYAVPYFWKVFSSILLVEISIILRLITSLRTLYVPGDTQTINRTYWLILQKYRNIYSFRWYLIQELDTTGNLVLLHCSVLPFALSTCLPSPVGPLSPLLAGLRELRIFFLPPQVSSLLHTARYPWRLTRIASVSSLALCLLLGFGHYGALTRTQRMAGVFIKLLSFVGHTRDCLHPLLMWWQSPYSVCHLWISVTTVCRSRVIMTPRYFIILWVFPTPCSYLCKQSIYINCSTNCLI